LAAISHPKFKLEMHDKAQRDSPVPVLLAPPGEYD